MYGSSSTALVGSYSSAGSCSITVALNALHTGSSSSNDPDLGELDGDHSSPDEGTP